MEIRYEVISDVGRVRTNNEDMALIFGEFIRDSSMSFSFEMPNNVRFTAVVADGMGGYENGEIASEMATKSFNTFLSKLPEKLDENDIIISVKNWAKECNDEIIGVANGTQMGCTFTGIFTYEDMAFIINIGDSRVYRLRYDHFKQLTTDHSERNRTDNKQAPSNLIYNALGVDNSFIDITTTKLIKEDRYIICSDGLHDMIDDNAIETIVTSGGGARQLVESALNAGGTDNVTVILLSLS